MHVRHGRNNTFRGSFIFFLIFFISPILAGIVYFFIPRLRYIYFIYRLIAILYYIYYLFLYIYNVIYTLFISYTSRTTTLTHSPLYWIPPHPPPGGGSKSGVRGVQTGSGITWVSLAIGRLSRAQNPPPGRGYIISI